MSAIRQFDFLKSVFRRPQPVNSHHGFLTAVRARTNFALALLRLALQLSLPLHTGEAALFLCPIFRGCAPAPHVFAILSALMGKIFLLIAGNLQFVGDSRIANAFFARMSRPL
jgi:hypothetical protein